MPRQAENFQHETQDFNLDSTDSFSRPRFRYTVLLEVAMRHSSSLLITIYLPQYTTLPGARI
jgi:hypothetical protein